MSKISEEILFQGRIFDLARETHRMPGQREARFELIQHSGSAAALPVLADGRLILIHQFRPAAQDYILEIPAGRLEVGEDAKECIARELQEEIGYQAADIEPLGPVYSSVGFCNEQIYLFIAKDLTATATELEPNEFIEPIFVTLEEALDMIAHGKIEDAKTQIALLRYAISQQEK